VEVVFVLKSAIPAYPEVFDLTGQLVLRKRIDQQAWDVSEFAAGVYWIRVEGSAENV
jgi:hypothetical protein